MDTLLTLDSDALVTATGGMSLPPGGGGSTGPTFPRPTPLPFPYPLPKPPGGPIVDPIQTASK